MYTRLLLVIFEDNAAGTSGVIINYLHNGTELVQRTQKSIGSAGSSVTIYSWPAGNMTEVRSGSQTTTLDYYTDKPSQPGNYLEAINLIEGYTIFKTKNLVKSVSAGSSPATITYIFGSDGNISQDVLISSTGNSTISFTYQCE